jgi:heat shock protein HslJ
MPSFRRAALAGALLLLAARVPMTHAADPPPAPLLEGTSWTLSALPGRTLLPGVTATLRFESGRATGSDGCNQYGGSYEAAGNGFRLRGDLVSTQRACAPAVQQQAQAYTAALRAARAIRLEGSVLSLLDAQGQPLATLAAQDQGLADTTWQVTGYNNGRQAVVSVLRDTTLTIEFLGNGRLGGSAGCNRYVGGYTQDGATLQVIRPAATRRLCAGPQGVMEQEAAFLAALESAARLRIDGTRLELRTADGRIAVGATRAGAAPPPPGGAGPGAGPAPTGGVAPAAPAGSAPVGAAVAGDLTYLADAAMLTECATGKRHPVAMEGDWLRMERGYRAAAPAPGAPLHVSFEGGLEQRPKMEGTGTAPTWVVRRFIHTWPGERCERARADANLANTYWRVVALGGEDVPRPADGRREAQLRIRAPRNDAPRGEYTATAGCNTSNGRYAVDGRSLRFAPGATTRMACPPPLDALERRLADTLARTATWRIEANTLELFDAGGASLGLFLAVYL